MKLTIAFTMLSMLTMNCFAEQLPITQEQLNTYKGAVWNNLDQNKAQFKCINNNSSNASMESVISALVSYTTKGTIDEDYSQPLLVFSSTNDNLVMSFTTSEDFKQIISIKSEMFNMVEVNTGSLLKPVMMNVRKLRSSSKCEVIEAL